MSQHSQRNSSKHAIGRNRISTFLFFRAMTITHPSPAQLGKLSPLQHMSTEELTLLATRLAVKTAGKRESILKAGDASDEFLFLLNGSVILKAIDDGERILNATDESALDPIARLRPSRFDVIANEKVEYLKIDIRTLHLGSPSNGGIILEEVEMDTMDPQLGMPNILTEQLEEDLANNRFVLPSLPDVAIKVGLALRSEFNDAKMVARVIAIDPAISSKIIKVANSSRYAGRAEINNLEVAVARIGLEATHQLVVLFALRELFRSKNSMLNKRMRELWNHCRKVAAICLVLAQNHEHLDPDTALLGGLIHDIGTVAILSYA